MQLNPIPASTRLRFRSLDMSDLDYIAELLGDDIVQFFFGREFTREEAVEWIERQRQRYDQHGFGFWLLLDRQTNEPVGQAGLLISEVDGVSEKAIGYMIHPSHRNAGFATEATEACLKFGYEQTGAERIITLIRPNNLASIRVAKKAGMIEKRRTTYKGYEHIVFVHTPGNHTGE